MVALAAILLVGILVVVYAGGFLAPVFAGLIIAYLLDGAVRYLSPPLPRGPAVGIVFVGFMLTFIVILFGLLPFLYNQISQFVLVIPQFLSRGEAVLMELPQKYPEVFSSAQVQQWLDGARSDLTRFGQTLLGALLGSAGNALTAIIYLILVPTLVFFFLLDKPLILNWIGRQLPADRDLANEVWVNVNRQIGNYIRGKLWEIVIVWGTTYAVFSWLGLDFAMLLAVLVGLSVIVPYIGAAVVTVPVLIVAWLQWGWSDDFVLVTIAYLIIQALDGNLLVPLLFSGVVKMHPIAIIIAVLFFGGLWGLLGVLFAIPLATLVQAVIIAWPRRNQAERSP